MIYSPHLSITYKIIFGILENLKCLIFPHCFFCIFASRFFDHSLKYCEGIVIWSLLKITLGILSF